MELFIGLVGLVVGAAVLALVLWLRSRAIVVKWYEWLIGAIGLLLLLFIIFAISSALNTVAEPATSLWFMLLLIGLPALILMVIAGSLAWRRHRTSS